jgi:uncharacterized protein
MMTLLTEIEPKQWLLLMLVALCIGMSKTGVTGLGLAVVPILAIGFGARESTGIMIPMLVMADVYAVIYYHRVAKWEYVLKLLPWTVAGILAGVITGKYISASTFRVLLSTMVLAGLGVMVIRDLRKKAEDVPENPWFAAFIGLLSGFSSMVGNAAGPVFAVYLLSMRLPKNSFIGTGAWFFFLINMFKIPFHIWVWKTVTLSTFTLNLFTLPLILAGAWLGIRIVKLFSESFYRIFVLATTFLSTLLLLLR